MEELIAIDKPKRRSQAQVAALEDARARKIDPVGAQIYGEGFTAFQRIADYKDLLPAFKDWYYEKKIKDNGDSLSNILRSFNLQVCQPMNRGFYPYPNQIRAWRAKWDLDLMQQLNDNKSLMIPEKKSIKQVLKTRDDNGEVILGNDYSQLEAGIGTLGGELVNDALQMLRDDQALEEVYDTEELIKRRNYITNVFAHVTRLVHGKAALVLKASEEKRNTAGFLMSLLAKATAGQMSDEEMALLKTAYATKPHEQQPQV